LRIRFLPRFTKSRKLRLITHNPCVDVGKLNERRERRQAKLLTYEEEARVKRFSPPWLSTLITVLESASAQTQNTNSRIIRIDAKPEAVAIDIKKTAVIVVDMQYDFGAKGGALDLSGIDISGIRKAIATVAKVLTSARHAGIKIVYLKMAFRPDLSDYGALGSPNRLKHLPLNVGKSIHAPNGRESRILIRDTWNIDIVDELKPHLDLLGTAVRRRLNLTEP
jgi:ureidoacrylate peracid hydrolase